MNPDGQQYRGVRGWLLLLCVNLTILDPLAIVLSLNSVTEATKPHFNQHPELLTLIVVSGVCRLALAVFSVYAGIALWRIQPGAVAAARKYLRFVLLYSVFAVFLPGLVGIPEDLYRQMAGPSIVNAMLTIVYASIWYVYLKRSKRVAVTFQPPVMKPQDETGL